MGHELLNGRFWHASTLELESCLTPIQKSILNSIWDRHISSGTAYPRRAFWPLTGKLTEEEALRGLNGSLIYETSDQGNDTSYKITLYGALLTKDGPMLAMILRQLLDVIRYYGRQDPLRTQLARHEIALRPKISEEDLRLLFNALTLHVPPSLPFHLANSAPNGSDWAIYIKQQVVDLYRADDVSKYLDERLLEGYDPNEPISFSERQSYHFGPKGRENKSRSSFDLVDTVLQEADIVAGKGRSPSIDGIADRERAVAEALSREATARRDSGTIEALKEALPEQPPIGGRSNVSASSMLTATRTETEATSDLLGREKLTQALRHLLIEREDDRPLAIGLFGHWGAGKSSQVKFLLEELKKTNNPKILVAEFNAWKNEKATNVGAMLAQAVVDGLLAEKWIVTRFWLALQLAALSKMHTRNGEQRRLFHVNVWLAWVWPWVPYLILLVPLGWVLWWIPSLTSKWVGLACTSVLSAYHFTRSHLTEWFKHIDVKKPLSALALPEYSAHRGLALEIHRTLEDLCGLCLKGSTPRDGTYLLLVVDDLDRCGVDGVKDVLDAVRLVANIPRVVTLVAVDERIAFSAVEKHYEKLGHGGRTPEQVARDYLSKVLQVSVTLPEVDSDRIARYVDSKIFVDLEPPAVASADGDEPVPHAQSPTAAGLASHSSRPITGEAPAVANAELEQAGQTQSSGQQFQSISSQMSQRQSSLLEEKNLFKELALAYSFSNPRLLWRIYMAWKLLKSLHFGTTYVFKDVELPMHLLFWREWLCQLTRDERDAFSKWVEDPLHTYEREPPAEIRQVVGQKLREKWQTAEPLVKVVDAVLLPAR